MEEHNSEQEKEESSKLLEELTKNSNKQLFYARLGGISMTVLALVITAALIVILPKAVTAIDRVNGIIVQAGETITLANEAITGVTQMSASITDMGDNMDTFISDNSQSIAEIMLKIEDIDFEGLNTAIKDLGDVIEPLARFFRIMQ